jgi:hypothetical protein
MVARARNVSEREIDASSAGGFKLRPEQGSSRRISAIIWWRGRRRGGSRSSRPCMYRRFAGERLALARLDTPVILLAGRAKSASRHWRNCKCYFFTGPKRRSPHEVAAESSFRDVAHACPRPAGSFCDSDREFQETVYDPDARASVPIKCGFDAILTLFRVDPYLRIGYSPH